MPSTLYVNKPGGVVLHLADGSTEPFAYGAPVDVSLLADYQKKNIGQFTDSDRRSESPEFADVAQRLKDAHQQSVNAHMGQVNSSANVVPGDYGQLDIDGAVALVRALEAYPEAQAQVYLHEKINYGRDKVLDAVSAQAREAGDNLLEQLHDQTMATHSLVPEPAIEGGDGGLSDEQKLEGEGLENLSKAKLVKLAKLKGVDHDGTADEIRERLQEHAAANAGGIPPTPPPSS